MRSSVLLLSPQKSPRSYGLLLHKNRSRSLVRTRPQQQQHRSSSSTATATATSDSAPNNHHRQWPGLRGGLSRQNRTFLSTAGTYGGACASKRNHSSSSSSSSSSLQKTPEEEGDKNNDVADTAAVSYLPVNLETRAKIEGEESQIVTIALNPGECIRAESGAMIFMTEGIEMETKLAGASSAFQRMMTGQNVFLTDFTCPQQQPSPPSSSSSDDDGKEGGGVGGTLCLGTDFPSKILRLNLQTDVAGGALVCQRGAFLASNPTVDIAMEFTKTLTAGFFGGQGFVLQRLTGEGDVLIKAGGTLVAKDLREGETLRATSGSIVAFETTVDYDVQMMSGVKNVMFGGEGLFVTKLTGPGRVWLQGLPPDRMIAEIARRVPGRGLGLGIPIGMGGGGGGGGVDDAEAAGEGGEEGLAAGESSEGGGEEQVAATDSAIEADRQATVASSGGAPVDGDSPSALFGDAAYHDKDAGGAAGGGGAAVGDDSSFASGSTEPTFMEDDSSFSTESAPTFDDEITFDDVGSSSDFPQDDSSSSSEFFGDDAGNAASDLGGEAADEGGGLFGMLWDLITGGDE